MTESPLKIDLYIKIDSDTVFATLVFLNEGPADYFIDPILVFNEGKVKKEVFAIVNDVGDEVEYLGMAIKYIPAPDSFIKIEKGKSLKFTAPIQQIYDLKKHSTTYSIKYMVFNSDYPGQEGLHKLESAIVNFKY